MWRKTSTQAERQREKFAREAMTHLDHLYRVAVHLAKEPDQAHDLVQETYARALGSYEQFVAGTHLKAWLTKILHNLFFDRYREAKRWVSIEEDKTGKAEEGDYWQTIPGENPGPESEVLRGELNTKISEAIKKLPEEFRMPIILIDMGDFSYAEAAEILSCPLGTVRSRVSRGRQLLRQKLKGYVGAKDTK
ncbi:MAG TPA: sigma-70 family RNA polymerase sigma factor [Candidatus Binatia bacterium]